MRVIPRWNRASGARWWRRWNAIATGAELRGGDVGMKVGVIGLGTMGMGAALNLHRKGHAVVGCEVREAGRAAFVAAGGVAVASPVELPADLDAVVVFVVNA